MTRLSLGAALAVLWTLPALAQRDDEIRRLLIEDSIARFSGYCPCPYSYDRGQQCADKSAYSRRAVLPPDLYCYANDVHWRDVEAYRQRMGIRR
jgi:hypothetical protein